MKTPPNSALQEWHTKKLVQEVNTSVSSMVDAHIPKDDVQESPKEEELPPLLLNTVKEVVNGKLDSMDSPLLSVLLRLIGSTGLSILIRDFLGVSYRIYYGSYHSNYRAAGLASTVEEQISDKLLNEVVGIVSKMVAERTTQSAVDSSLIRAILILTIHSTDFDSMGFYAKFLKGLHQRITHEYPDYQPTNLIKEQTMSAKTTDKTIKYEELLPVVTPEMLRQLDLWISTTQRHHLFRRPEYVIDIVAVDTDTGFELWFSVDSRCVVSKMSSTKPVVDGKYIVVQGMTVEVPKSVNTYEFTKKVNDAVCVGALLSVVNMTYNGSYHLDAAVATGLDNKFRAQLDTVTNNKLSVESLNAITTQVEKTHGFSIPVGEPNVGYIYITSNDVVAAIKLFRLLHADRIKKVFTLNPQVAQLQIGGLFDEEFNDAFWNEIFNSFASKCEVGVLQYPLGERNVRGKIAMNSYLLHHPKFIAEMVKYHDKTVFAVNH